MVVGLLHLIVLLPPACICTGVDGQTVVPWWCRQGRRKEGNDRLDFGQLDSSVLRDCMHAPGSNCTRYSYKVFEVPTNNTVLLAGSPLQWRQPAVPDTTLFFRGKMHQKGPSTYRKVLLKSINFKIAFLGPQTCNLCHLDPRTLKVHF